MGEEKRSDIIEGSLLIIVILYLVLLGTCSCNSIEEDNQEIEDLPVVTRKGYEYLKMHSYGGNHIYTHVGQCKNPRHYFKDNNQYKYVIDLPEEYSLISADNLHPDTLTAYVSRDTLYIQFFNKRKP